MKTFLLTVSLLLPAAAPAAVIIQSFSLSTPAAIPDGDASGLLQSLTPETTIGVLDSITVTLSTTGGWNGDFYAYLWHDNKISVLLNRTGRTTGNPEGSSTGTMIITLADSAPADIHNAPGTFGSSLNGTFQPSGRNTNPFNTLDTSARTALLSTLSGTPATGEYRLFIADLATGSTGTLQSWSINLTGQAIPEPGSAALGALAALTLLRRHRKVGVRA